MRRAEGPAKSLACLVRAGQLAPPGYGLYLTTEAGTRTLAVPGTPRRAIPGAPGPVLTLGPELAHLNPGDIIHVPADGRRVTVLWKNSARHNALLLTEQCDNYCLMCSQPPKDRDDSWLFERARKVISLLPPGARSLSLTGGEPTLDAGAFIGLLEHCKQVAPELSIHLLSNGRRFADPAFARRYATVGLADIMAGIPVYAPEPGLHDFVVRAAGAFDQTLHGILNLASLGQAVEIRIVVQRHTVPVLAGLATFIVRNLPFVAQVALMGLEMTGLARPNSALVWADPADYQRELAEAVGIRDGRDPGADLQPPALRPRPAPVAVRGPLDQRLEERLPGHLPLLLGPRHMRRRLHNKRQPPQRAPAPGALISPPLRDATTAAPDPPLYWNNPFSTVRWRRAEWGFLVRLGYLLANAPHGGTRRGEAR